MFSIPHTPHTSLLPAAEPREILDLELPKPIDPVADKIYGGGGGGGDGGGRRPGGMGDRMERMAGRAGDAVEMRAETFGVSRDAVSVQHVTHG